MISQKSSRREKDSLAEFESQLRDLRQQLTEQLRCLENKVETESTILAELQEFVRRRAEIETTYGKQLERLCRQMLAQHKADRTKRENWRNYSTFRCWQAAVLNARSVSQDHILFGELLGSHVATRLGELIEDSQRLFRKCKTTHAEYQDELIKSIAELQTAMKMYHGAFSEFAAAQHKLAVLESQREKLQAQFTFKHVTGKDRERDRERHEDKERLPRSASAEKRERAERQRRSASAAASRRQESEAASDAPITSSASAGANEYRAQRAVQSVGTSNSTSALLSLAFVCGSHESQGSTGCAPLACPVSNSGAKPSSSAGESPRESALLLTDSGVATGSLKGLGSSSTLIKKLRSIERQCEKKRTKCAECRAKALRSRNDYLLTLEACNASLSRLFTDDVPDLIDCMNCGYHTSLCNSMLMQLYAEAALAQTHQANVETVGRCCSHLDAREDKQRFLKERTNYAAFNAGRHWPFQSARGDPNAPAFVAPPPNSVAQDELLARCATLRTRLDQLRVDADTSCKALRDSGTRLLERLAAADYDVSARFDAEQRRETFNTSPRLGDPQLRSSAELDSRPTEAADDAHQHHLSQCNALLHAADAFSPEKRREARAERADLELSFTTAFRKYVYANQQATRVHAQLETVQRALLDNPDYVRLAHALGRAASRAAPTTSGMQPCNASQQSNTKSYADVLVRLVCAPIEKPRRRRLLKAPTLVRPRLFGGYLEDYVLANGCDIPPVVISCIRVLSRFGLRHQGLFRVSGAATDINELRMAFERGEDPLDEMLTDFDVNATVDRRNSGDKPLFAPQKLNAVASLLKLYFRELAEPLFPTELFDDFVATIYCLQVRDFQLHPLDARRACLSRLRELVATLSRPVRATMRYLFAFLKHVSESCEHNMMDPANLAICFGPTLMPIPDHDQQVRLQAHVNELVKAFIVYSSEIFDDPSLSGPLYAQSPARAALPDASAHLNDKAMLNTGTASSNTLVDDTPRSPVQLHGTLSRSMRNLTSSTLTLTRVGAARQPAVVVVQVHSAAERDLRSSLSATRFVDATTQTPAATVAAHAERELVIEALTSDLGASLSSTSSQTRLVSSASPMNEANFLTRSPSTRTNDDQASPKSSLGGETTEYDMATLRPDCTNVILHQQVASDASIARPLHTANFADLADYGNEQTSQLAAAMYALHQHTPVQPADALLYAATTSAEQPTRAVAAPCVEVAREPTAFSIAAEREPVALVETAIDVAPPCMVQPRTNSTTYVTGVYAGLPSIAECAAETNIDVDSSESDNMPLRTHANAYARRDDDARSTSGTDEDAVDVDVSYDDEDEHEHEHERQGLADDDADAPVIEAVAACDYEAGTDQEISFHRGDTILLFARVSDDWWTGVANGLEGLVPHRYITVNFGARRRPGASQASQSATPQDLPPPIDDTPIQALEQTDDERQIDEALEHAMHGIEANDDSWPEAPAAVNQVTRFTSLYASSIDRSPDSDCFPQPPTPAALATAYNQLLNDYGTYAQPCDLPLPAGDSDADADDELMAAATRQQTAGDLLEELAARFEEMRATPTNIESENGRNASAYLRLSHDGDVGQPPSLAEVFAKTDHPTMKKGTSLASTSSSSVDTACVTTASSSVAAPQIQNTSQSSFGTIAVSQKDATDTTSLSSVRSAPADGFVTRIITAHASSLQFSTACEDAQAVTVTAVPVRVALEPSGARFDLRKSVSPELLATDRLALVPPVAVSSVNSSRLSDDAGCSLSRISPASSESNSMCDAAATTVGWRKPAPAVMPKPKPPQRTSSLCAQSNADGTSPESCRSDEAPSLSVSAKRALFETQQSTAASASPNESPMCERLLPNRGVSQMTTDAVLPVIATSESAPKLILADNDTVKHIAKA